MLEVIKPGSLTTLQDYGRVGYHHVGVSTGGAMDKVSFELASLLVGNSLQTAALEITLAGTELRFHEQTVIALAGAELVAELDGYPISTGRRIAVSSGSTLKFTDNHAGCRVYLAVEGGFEIPQVLGSESTLLIAGVGGGYGRPLKKGDMLTFRKKGKDLIQESWFIDTTSHWTSPTIRYWQGPEWEWFSSASHSNFSSKPYYLTEQANRMGYRLAGPSMETTQPRQMISEAVTMGTIQVPADGSPIVLMADGQTTGGYPRIGQVASVDLPKLAQRRPRDPIYFEQITLLHARNLERMQRQWMKELRFAVESQLARGNER